jgi:integrase
MRAAGEKPDGLRLRALIVLLRRAGLRVGKALALAETDLDRSRGAVLVRRGKGGKRREVGMDRWAWHQLDPWLQIRPDLPVGALLCVIRPHPADGTGRRPPLENNSDTPQNPLGFGGGSLLTSSAMHTRSRWPTKASRSWSSNDSSDTPTSGSPGRVESGRGVGVAAGPFPRPALRTEHAHS